MVQVGPDQLDSLVRTVAQKRPGVYGRCAASTITPGRTTWVTRILARPTSGRNGWTNACTRGRLWLCDPTQPHERRLAPDLVYLGRPRASGTRTAVYASSACSRADAHAGAPDLDAAGREPSQLSWHPSLPGLS